ncbi:MAG: zinc ABC transporter substrate-binding protein [Planctomyces sp.]|nr:zinc ABC transporter substrate-binding protein [Planctomyces sp.]
MAGFHWWVHMKRYVGLVLLLLAGSCGCSDPAGPITQEKTTGGKASETEEVLRVVATFSVLGDWLREIGGDAVEVTTLVGPGSDAHTYEPTPADGAAVAESSVVFEVGLGFESWLESFVESSHPSVARVVVTRKLKGRVLDESVEHQELDPHVWHDPALVISMVQEIETALISKMPHRADEFRLRASNYVTRLKELDQSIKDLVALIPEDRRRLVTTHDTFGYFAERYGFRVSSILGSVSSEVSDPSAAELAVLIDEIRRERVAAIFTENILSPELTQQVAAEAGTRVVTGLYTDALGPPGSSGDTYLGMMESNISLIAEALR